MPRETILLIHSIFGVIIFCTGLAQIIMKKGGLWHRRIGQVYSYSWIILLITGAFLGDMLITIVGIFGFYFVLTGTRLGQIKEKTMTLFDKGIIVAALLIALSMLYYAFVLYTRGSTSFAIIFAVFGAIFCLTTIEDLYKYVLNKPLKTNDLGKLDWYFEHFKRMFISFIAAVTAFVSIQNVFGNNTLNFLMPTVIGTVLIIMTSKRYRKKLITN